MDWNSFSNYTTNKYIWNQSRETKIFLFMNNQITT